MSMNIANSEPSSPSDEWELSSEIYDIALISGENEELTDPDGESVDWLLDMRIPLLDGNIARRLGNLVANRLRMKGCRQVAGFGLGGHAMVCATINADGYPRLIGGFIRSQRKPHGRCRLIEGPLDRQLPVVLLDDLLNSGETALRGLAQLRHEGFQVAGCLTIFEYDWGEGRKKLERKGMWVNSLMELTLSQNDAEDSDSDADA